MVVTLNLTKNHLKLIPFLFTQEIDDNIIGIDKDITFNMGSHALEDIAIILGMEDKALRNTKNDAEGMAFDDETEEYLLSLLNFFIDNLYYIETLVHQFAIKGGLSVGTYKALDNELIWEKLD